MPHRITEARIEMTTPNWIRAVTFVMWAFVIVLLIRVLS